MHRQPSHYPNTCCRVNLWVFIKLDHKTGGSLRIQGMLRANYCKTAMSFMCQWLTESSYETNRRKPTFAGQLDVGGNDSKRLHKAERVAQEKTPMTVPGLVNLKCTDPNPMMLQSVLFPFEVQEKQTQITPFDASVPEATNPMMIRTWASSFGAVPQNPWARIGDARETHGLPRHGYRKWNI